MFDTLSVNPNRILIPIAFNTSSDAALNVASMLAEKFGVELYLLHIIFDFPGGSVSETAIIDRAKKRAADQFAVWQSGFISKGVKATTRIEVGSDVAETILNAIERENPGLVVLATETEVFGMITEKLVRLAPCSVLLLRKLTPGA